MLHGRPLKFVKSDYRALTLLTSTTLLGNVQTAQSCMNFDLDALIKIEM